MDSSRCPAKACISAPRLAAVHGCRQVSTRSVAKARCRHRDVPWWKEARRGGDGDAVDDGGESWAARRRGSRDVDASKLLSLSTPLSTATIALSRASILHVAPTYLSRVTYLTHIDSGAMTSVNRQCLLPYSPVPAPSRRGNVMPLSDTQANCRVQSLLTPCFCPYSSRLVSV